jgi:soluble lytic murein transglycosylase-like protein
VACKMDLRDMIASEASAQSVPPEIALAVAAQESGICHWTAGGAVVLGRPTKYGRAIGVMQLLPSTADNLGVDPYDVQDNIHGGVKYLRQLYDRYGDWTLAVQHYNGSGPDGQRYATEVMARARGYGFGLALANSTANAPAPVDVQTSATVTLPVVNAPVSKNLLIAVGIVAGAGVLALVIAS